MNTIIMNILCLYVVVSSTWEFFTNIEVSPSLRGTNQDLYKHGASGCNGEVCILCQSLPWHVTSAFSDHIQSSYL